jgi:hypothetical protein
MKQKILKLKVMIQIKLKHLLMNTKKDFANHAHVQHRNNVMTHLRKVCSYIKNSTKCKERLQVLQSKLVAILNVKLGVMEFILSYDCQSCKADVPLNSFLILCNFAAG